jgi:monoamine oxidase
VFRKRIVIAGAGISGLITGCELAENNFEVTILEARNRCGGRIFTSEENNFSRAIEAGAEFVHGKVPFSMSLVNDCRLKTTAMKGRIYRLTGDELTTEKSFVEGENTLNRKLKSLDENITVEEFLQKYFNEEEDAELISSVKKFVEGYDAADSSKASALSFKDEWLKEDDDEQLHIEGGYGKIITHLKKKFLSAGGKIIYETVVDNIDWLPDQVSVHCKNGNTYKAEKAILTIPLIFLRENTKGAISFTPALPRIYSAAEKIGYGHVIKFIIEFNFPFWEEGLKEYSSRKTPDLMFLFTDETIPTWWSQSPEKLPLLSGWLAGPHAEKLKSETNDVLMEKAYQSLANIYEIPVTVLKNITKAAFVKNWSVDEFSRGAYTYNTPDSDDARKTFDNGINNTIFFAGEAYYSGKETGTVEAAAASAVRVCRKLTSTLHE